MQIANQVTYHFADHKNSLQIKQSTRNKQIADLLAKQIATTIQKWFLTQILPHTYLIQFADHRSKKTQCSLCKIQDSDCRPTLQAEQSTSNKQIADLLAKQTATTIQKGFLTQILPHRYVT